MIAVAISWRATPSRAPRRRLQAREGCAALKRQRTLAMNETWATSSPSIRWMGIRVSGLMTPKQHATLDYELSLAGDWMGHHPRGVPRA